MPAAPLGDLALHEPHKLASTTPPALGSGLQCPRAASPETQNLTKDAGLIKRHFLSSALVPNQFPPLLCFSQNEFPDQSRSSARGAWARLRRAHGCQPSAELQHPPGKRTLLQGHTVRGTSARAVGCQHPACCPGSEAVLTLQEAPSPESWHRPFYPSGIYLVARKLRRKKNPSYHVQQLRLPGRRETDSFQMAQ